MKLPKKLKEVTTFLQKQAVDVCNEVDDGRINSIKDEGTIIEVMLDEYGEENIIPQLPRWWYDVGTFGHIVNIKSTTGGIDNLSGGSKAMLYALTDLSISEIEKCCNTQTFIKLLKSHKKPDNKRDYYCLTLHKKTNDVICRGLKSLVSLTSNGSNLPFQINWKEQFNSQPVKRTPEEAYRFIVNAWQTSVDKRIAAQNGYKEL